MAPIYDDWSTLPAALAEQIARVRVMEQARLAVGAGNLTEQAAADAAVAEAIGGGSVVKLADDPKSFNTKYPNPALDLLVSILSKRGVQHFNDSGVLEQLADEPTGHVTCYGRRHKQWGSTFGDGQLRLLTQAEIDAHPEWIGKYLAGVHSRDDVLWCEAIYTASSNHPSAAKARGVIASVTDHGGGVLEYGLTLDSGAAIDAKAGLVSTLPLLGAGGLFNEGMRGAMLMAVDGAHPFVCHMVQDNTATTVTTSENLTPPTPFGGDYRLAVGDHVEVVQFHGTGFAQYTKRVEIGNLALNLTRGVGITFTVGLSILGMGQASSKVNVSTKNTPGIVTNGLAYSHFEGWWANRTAFSNRPWFDIDQTGFVTGNGLAAASSQQNTWMKMQLGGFYPFGGFDPNNRYDARGGTSFAAPVAIVSANTDPGWITLNAPKALVANELSACWMVIKSSADQRKIGMRFLVTSHLAVGLGAAVQVNFFFKFPTSAVQPVAGDTVFFECGDCSAIDLGAGKIYVNGSTGPQGSENTIIACQAGGYANWAYGSLTANALQQSLLGGNIEVCPNWGVFSFWGNWTVTGVGFQSNKDNSYNQYLNALGDPTNYGADAYIGNSVVEGSTFIQCRSESPRFLCTAGAQFVHVIDCGDSGFMNTDLPFQGVWQAHEAVRAHGTDCRQLPSFLLATNGPNRTGGFWVLAQTQPGGIGPYGSGTSTTSGAEPAWATVGAAPGYNNRQVVEGGGGAGGTDNLNWMEVDSYYNWLHNFTSKGFRAIQGNNVVIDGFRCRNLRVQLGGNDIGRLEVDRADWIGDVPGDYRTPGTPGAASKWRIRGPIFVVPPIFEAFPTWGMYAGPNPVFDSFPLADHIGGIEPQLWSVGKVGNDDQIMWQGGWGPGARNTAVLSPFGRHQSESAYLTSAVIAAPAPRIVNPYHSFDLTAGTRADGGSGLTDVPGKATKIGVGLGTGAGAPGTIDFEYAAAGSTGTVEQSYVGTPAHRVDSSGRLVKLRGEAASTGAVTNIAAAGNATPDAAAKKVHRYNLQGATATINNPTGLVDGSEFVLDIANGSGGASAVTLGAVFLGTFPAPTTGKRRTQPYVYDAVAAKLVPVGAQSGDL